MKIPLIFSDNKSIDLFKRKNFLNLINLKNYRCICGRVYPLESIKVRSQFYTCPYCESYRKFNEKNISTDEIYEVDIRKLMRRIKEKLDELEVFTIEKFNEQYLSFKGLLIPIVLLENSSPSNLDPQNYSFILYYNLSDFQKYSNVYSQKRMMELGDFFNMDKDSFNKFLSSQEKYAQNNQILAIKNKIASFCSTKSPEDFEKEITKLFLLLKGKNTEIESMLNFFNRYKNILIAKKPIHIGGNHPADIEFIDLFDYFNQLFDLDKNRGADTKRYNDAEITEHTITQKMITNHGKELVFITNQNKISNTAWKYIWDAMETNKKWTLFILDLDLLSLLVYHLRLDDLFN